MSSPLAAEDLFPLVEKLSAEERLKLARYALRNADDAARYAAMPVEPDEFSQDDDSAAWEADGWDDTPDTQR